MMKMNEAREQESLQPLSNDEIDLVSGGVHVVEFRIGPAGFQLDIVHGTWTVWNGKDVAGTSEK